MYEAAVGVMWPISVRKGESLVACFYAITHIVSTVMRHLEAGYGEITRLIVFSFSIRRMQSAESFSVMQ